MQEAIYGHNYTVRAEISRPDGAYLIIPFPFRLFLCPDDTDKSVSHGFFVRSYCPKHCFVEHSICRNVRDSSEELLCV